MGIPVKVNVDSVEGSRTAFRSQGEQQSERSDAGVKIVPEVFGFVNGITVRLGPDSPASEEDPVVDPEERPGAVDLVFVTELGRPVNAEGSTPLLLSGTS